MQVFDQDEVADIQNKLNRSFSLTGGLKVSEDFWSPIYTGARSLPSMKVSNLAFNDLVTPERGVEWKCLKRDNPIADFGGRVMHPSVSRRIKVTPTVTAQEGLDQIVAEFNQDIRAFSDRCGGNIFWGVVLYDAIDTLVYFEEPMQPLPPNLTATWEDQRSRGAVSRNLYARDSSGRKVLSYLPNGHKLQLYFDVPTLEHTHVFRAQKQFEPLMIDLDLHQALTTHLGSLDRSTLINLLPEPERYRFR